MASTDGFRPLRSANAHKVLVPVFDDACLLDIAGPTEVFATANAKADLLGPWRQGYSVRPTSYQTPVTARFTRLLLPPRAMPAARNSRN